MRYRSRMIAGLLAFSFAALAALSAWAQSEELTRNYQRGSSLFEAGMYKASTPYFVRALELSEVEFGSASSRTAFVLKNLATVYAKQGRYEEAEPLYIRALHVFEEAFGPHHGVVAEVTNELSIVYVERERFIEAEPLLGRVLDNLERTFGSDDPRVAVAAYNYGFASEYLGDADKARTLYAKALQIWQSSRVPDDARIRAARDRLAGLRRVRETKGPSLAPYLPRVLPGQAVNPPSAPQIAVKAPPSVPNTARESRSAAPSSIASVPPARAPARVTPTEERWRVQLASFRSRETAEQESARLTGTFDTLFGPAGGLKIAEAVLPKGTFYRLVVEPFERRDAALALCNALKAESQQCIVARQK